MGAYIGAAYWFTSSTSFANPAVTIGRAFSDTFAGIAPGSVPGSSVPSWSGPRVAVGLVAWLYPHVGDTADDVVIPLRPPPQPTDRARPRSTAMTTTMSRHAHTPQVVFACVRNGGRSVISRVLAEHYAGGRVAALSAGTQPGDHIHPEVAEVLEKLGLDTSREQPTLLTRETIAASDLAITLGCGEECPYVPGVVYATGRSPTRAARTRPRCAASSPTSTPGSAPCSSSSSPTSSCRPRSCTTAEHWRADEGVPVSCTRTRPTAYRVTGRGTRP